MENHSNGYFTGIESSMNADINKWLSVNLSSSWYHAIIRANIDKINKTIETNIFNFRANSTFNTYKYLKLQFTLYYEAPFDYIQSYISDNFNINISVRKEFPKYKASITFTAKLHFWVIKRLLLSMKQIITQL